MTTPTDYAGSYIYKNNSLEFFSTPEGYVEPTTSGGYNYIYQYKDHLGNVRLSYSDGDGDGTIDLADINGTDLDGDGDAANEIVEENNYYPFGLKHKGYNSVVNSTNIGQDFRYNGVELEESLGLNLYEMELRQYDPAIARWTGNDPVLHFNYSPYQALDNNPLFWSDPSGADSWTYIDGAYMNNVTGETTKDWRRAVAETTNSRGCCGGGPLPSNLFFNPESRVNFFKSFFPQDGTARDLIDHYSKGSEETYTLNLKQMLDIYPLKDQEGNPRDLSLSMIEMLRVGELSPGESKPFEDHIKVYAGTAGTLGNFTLTRKGFVTLNEETGKREFIGNFIFDDTFDFNAGKHRAWNVELQVTLARNFLPGKPFRVYGKLSVHQIQGGSIKTKVNSASIYPANYPKPKNSEERSEVSN